MYSYWIGFALGGNSGNIAKVYDNGTMHWVVHVENQVFHETGKGFLIILLFNNNSN